MIEMLTELDNDVKLENPIFSCCGVIIINVINDVMKTPREIIPLII